MDCFITTEVWLTVSQRRLDGLLYKEVGVTVSQMVG